MAWTGINAVSGENGEAQAEFAVGVSGAGGRDDLGALGLERRDTAVDIVGGPLRGCELAVGLVELVLGFSDVKRGAVDGIAHNGNPPVRRDSDVAEPRARQGAD